jgi:hypothetical protein
MGYYFIPNVHKKNVLKTVYYCKKVLLFSGGNAFFFFFRPLSIPKLYPHEDADVGLLGNKTTVDGSSNIIRVQRV